MTAIKYVNNITAYDQRGASVTQCLVLPCDLLCLSMVFACRMSWLLQLIVNNAAG